MKLLVIDNDMDPGGAGSGLDLAVRAADAGHSERLFLPHRATGDVGKGMVELVEDWEASMDWAELIVLTGNADYGQKLQPYFKKGYPIFGANADAAAWELDRALGQQVLERSRVKVAGYETVDDIDAALEIVESTGRGYAIKPWGGESDKSMTCVARDADEAIFMLELWKRRGCKGKLMLQEKVDGVEVGIAGWFGPGGWCRYVEESFEHKKFLTGDLGQNTGEMGTVIRHVLSSKLFDLILEPLGEQLRALKYTGDCAVNCIVDERGVPWPLEFTMRLGWPDFCIRQAVINHDPVSWMADLLAGKDSFSPEEDVAVGVLLAHGDFPTCRDKREDWEGFPISGVSAGNWSNLHFQQVMDGRAPQLLRGGVRRTKSLVSAGTYLMVVSGTGLTVAAAAKAAYRTVKQLSMPSNLMYRTDIGDRLKEDLPELQKHGLAAGMQY